MPTKAKNNQSQLHTVRLPLQLSDRLKDLAARSGDSVSDIIKWALEEYLQREEERAV